MALSEAATNVPRLSSWSRQWVILLCLAVALTCTWLQQESQSMQSHHGVVEPHKVPRPFGTATEFMCTWAPNHDRPCVQRVTKQIQESLQSSGGVPLNRHRWLFFGDSTMYRMWSMSPLSSRLSNKGGVQTQCPKYACSNLYLGDCDLNEVMLQTTRPAEWIGPNYSLGEGPLGAGVWNPFCHDCQGCSSALVQCRNQDVDATHASSCTWSNTASPAVYGGFVTIEFARDVESQSHEYRTTQESVLLGYVNRTWNTAAHVRDFGRPICVAGTGFHDMVIPNISLAKYLTNVEWYVDLLLTACDHVVWMGNNCPDTDDFTQKQELTYEWNMGVRDLLLERDRTSFIDVYNSSQSEIHGDNLHMGGSWYASLGSMVLQIIAA